MKKMRERARVTSKIPVDVVLIFVEAMRDSHNCHRGWPSIPLMFIILMRRKKTGVRNWEQYIINYKKTFHNSYINSKRKKEGYGSSSPVSAGDRGF